MTARTLHRKFDITPDVRTFGNLGATGEPAYKALAELIDNPLDARNGRRVTVDVGIKIRGGKVLAITIEDNASGMGPDELAQALRLGGSNKRDAKMIGRFGFGLKTALASLGTRWHITTARTEDAQAWQASLALDRLNDWSVDVYGLGMKTAEHGTFITIEGCEHLHAPTLLRDFELQLGELFRHFIDSKQLLLSINNEPVHPPAIELLDDSRIAIDLPLGFTRVTGWAGVRPVGSTRYGFTLFRNGRAIEVESKIGFAPDGHYTRVVGELHLDGFAVDHHKTRFVKTGPEWAALTAQLAQALAPVLTRARDLVQRDRKRIHPDTKRLLGENVNTLVGLVRKLDFARLVLQPGGQTAGPRTEKAPRAAKPVDPGVTPEEVRLPGLQPEEKPAREKRPPKDDQFGHTSTTPLGGKLSIACDFLALGVDAPPKTWSAHEDGHLAITLNTDHPLWPATGEQYRVAYRCCAEALAAFLATETARQTGLIEASLASYEMMLDRILVASRGAHLIVGA